MNDFIELFDENDLKDLNIEPIKKSEVRKIVRSLSAIPTKKKPHMTPPIGKVYLPPEQSKHIIKMMLS